MDESRFEKTIILGGMPFRGTLASGSLNDITTQGLYAWSSGVTNTPFEYGILEVVRISNYLIQRGYNVSGGRTFAVRVGNNAWAIF